MSIEIDLDGQVAVVSGAGSGIGEAIAKTLARAGAPVAIADIDAHGAERVVHEIVEDGGVALAMRLDISDPAAVEQTWKAITSELGRVHILVNNAAGWSVGSFMQTSDDDIDRTFRITVNGTMNMCRAALPDMTDGSGGRIVNIISDAGRIGEPFMTVYSGAKSGLVGFTRALAKEVARKQVTVNGVSPGTTKTPASAAFIAESGEERLAKMYPMGRLGEPQDIANAVLFMASPLAGYVTGQILSVSGGYSTV